MAKIKSLKLGVIMDPIASLHVNKDSTIAMLREAHRRQYEIYYFELSGLFLKNEQAFGEGYLLNINQDEANWYQLEKKILLPLASLDMILMRKDPPVDEQYWHATYILDYAVKAGVLVANRPDALREANEKLFALNFPQCIPKTLVTSSIEKLKNFWREENDIVCKPLQEMGGASVFRLPFDEVNGNAIFSALTHQGKKFVMAQRYLKEIKEGDKRILLVNGEPFSYGLLRVPQENDWRGNLALGAKGQLSQLTARELFICHEVKPVLKKMGLYFVGLDVIGDYLTEINVTSPTGIREIDAALKINISAQLFDELEKVLVKE